MNLYMTTQKKSFSINLDNKPNLRKAFDEDREVFREVVGTFVEMMEESLSTNKGISWQELPQLIHRDLSFRDLIAGILHGTLDVKAMNPDLFSALKVEAHPLAMLSPRKDLLSGEMRLRNWRAHFRQPDNAVVNQQTIANILRTVLRYTRYVSIKDLADAMDTNQELTFRGLGSHVMELLPMRPALEYQRKLKGDLYVGTFDTDSGGLDCGDTIGDSDCPACKKKDVVRLKDKLLCYDCNASFTIKGDF